MSIIIMETKLIFTNLVGEALDSLANSLGNPQAAIIADVNTAQFVLPLLHKDSRTAAAATLITVRAGEDAKSIEELSRVWRQLDRAGMTRSSLIINLGGGVVTDLGGFAAATFKRGIRFVNIPTSVLGAVDASYGSKTGINFDGAKNQIGVFADPEATIISSIYFNTLTTTQILSGYAEMLKHALLDSRGTLDRLLAFSPVYPQFDSERMLPLIEASSEVKRKVVSEDPRETGPRKVLNLGHTVGHAIESLALSRQSAVAHGYAVAWGCVTALILSHLELGFPSDILHKFADYVLTNFGAWPLTCDDYPALLEYMRKDKKNKGDGKISFTLLTDVGQAQTDCACSEERIEAALDIYRDLMHLP